MTTPLCSWCKVLYAIGFICTS